MGEEQMFRTTLWSAGCGSHGGCGVKVYVRDGKVTRIEGDENHPNNKGRLCPKGLAITQYMYHPDRVTHPLKRVGKRGEGKWEQISWEEAYDIIENRFREIRDNWGAESVIFCQGTGRDIGGPISYLMYSYGSPNWTQVGLGGQGCYTPRLGTMYATMGDYTVVDCSQFLEKRYDDPQYKVPEVIMIWAQNPVTGCSDAFYLHWIIDCMKRGSKLIVVDPRVTWAASRAELFLQARPQTDGALALGMLNVIINEELYDKEFVSKWCYGFDELKERVQEYTPEKVAEITWLAKEQIIEAARMFAKAKPGAIHWGVPIDHGPEATVAAQAINHLWAITGNVEVPGGMVFAKASHGVSSYPYAADEARALFGAELFDNLSKKRIGADKYPMVRDFRAWVQPDVMLEQMESGKPYPIKGAWIQTSNFLSGQASDPQRHYNAMKDMEFIVMVDLFHNPTSEALADIFLPSTCSIEGDSIRSWWTPLIVMPKTCQVGECKSDWEINLTLAKRLGLNPIPFETPKDLFNERFKAAGLDFTFDELVEKGGWEMTPEGPTKPYYRHERGLLRKDGKPGFNTPTGKIELYSKRFEGWGLDPLPYFKEAYESPVSTPEVYKEYPLLLNSGVRTSNFFHSEHRMIPWLREITPDPWVQINTQTAKDLGIVNGEWVYVESRMGKIKVKAIVTPAIHPKVVAVPHGWWLPEDKDKEGPNYFSTQDHNVNNLVPMCIQSTSGFGSTGYRQCLCRITKIEK